MRTVAALFSPIRNPISRWVRLVGVACLSLLAVSVVVTSPQAHADDGFGTLVAHWAFDEATAGVAVDSVGSNDGTPGKDGTGVPAPSTDVPPVSFDDPYSASFNGSDSVTVSNPVSENFSICAWVKTTSAGGGVNHWESAPILDAESGGPAYDFGFGVGNGGKLMFGNGGLIGGSLVDGQVNGATIINDGTWHNVCVTRDNSNGEVTLYVDAKADGSGTTGTGSLTVRNVARVGSGYDGPNKFVGLIDDLRVYNTALSPTQLANLTAGSDNPDSAVLPATLTPAPGAVDVATDAGLRMDFAHAPISGSGNVTIFRTDDDSLVEAIPAGDSARVTMNDSTVTITFANALESSTRYYVLVDGTAFKKDDAAFYPGITDSSAWSFTTIKAPPVISRTPQTSASTPVASTTVASTTAAPSSAVQQPDDDGVAAPIEHAAPNRGDANDDGVPDAEQPMVASFPNISTGQYVSIAVDNGCALSKAAGASRSTGTGDQAFTYPVGLVGYTAQCAVGTTVGVQAYFYGAPDTDLVARKFDPATGVYTSIGGAKLTRLTIGGLAVVRVSYQVADGGPLDSDGIVNGSIVDPVGLAQTVIAQPSVGSTPTVPAPAAPALASTGARGTGPMSVAAGVAILAGLCLLFAARRRYDEPNQGH